MKKFIFDNETTNIMKNLKEEASNQKNTNEIIRLIDNLLPENISIIVSEGGRDGVIKGNMFFFDAKKQKHFVVGVYNGPFLFSPIIFKAVGGLTSFTYEICDTLNSYTHYCYFDGTTQHIFTIDFVNKTIDLK